MHVGQTVYVVVTNHPDHKHTIHENEISRPAYVDVAEAVALADAWNSYYTETNTPQPWPFYALKCVVLPAKSQYRMDLGLTDC